MIKVVHLIANLELGGAEVFVSNLIKYQKLNDIELELWCLEKSRNNEFETKVINILKKANISVIVLTEKKNKIKRIVNLVKNIRRFKPDIINSHLIHVTIYSILGKYLSLNYNLKIIETIHNTKLGNKILHKLISNYLTNKTIAITEKVREILINEAKIKSEKINVIENGIEYFNQKYKLRQEVKKIIAVGRLTEQKNHIFLLRAYRLLKESLKTVPLLEIYGEGELREELQNYINENNLQDNIKLKGLTLNIIDKILESDIYVLVSNYEGLSISLLEAINIGIPMIGTKVPGIKDIISEKNLIELNNEEELKSNLKTLIENYQLREEESKKLLELSKKYLIENKAIEYNSLYKSILLKEKKNDLYF